MIAKLISIRRSQKEAGESYGELGGKSPLLQNSLEQAQSLELLLNADKTDTFKCFVCMRYWHPMSDEIASNVASWNPDRIVLLPLYPQYSTTTTRSSWQSWQKSAKKAGLTAPEKFVCCYPSENGFITASAAHLREAFEKAEVETGIRPRVLFSAHGLPESVIAAGDPYQWQCERGAEDIANAAGIEKEDWRICYQSRVGPKKWIGPSSEEELHAAAKEGLPVVILPHAFTQEHVETLVEIEIEYRELAERIGVPGFYRVQTVGAHPDFIRGLADTVHTATASPAIASYVGAAYCTQDFKQCAMRELSNCGRRC
jgi:ferrochelatase